ncbi:Ig-like domain-containing protein [Neobacillus sp. NPDC097160]|uniref:Ig-like domain-containing protein n=1 Tax=Neobacillus sp. NPDC097160 TaxID=3364298 RepID=UPI0038132F86
MASTAPTINPITQLSTSISGTATHESNIKILNGSNKVVGEGVTDSYGNYSVPVTPLIGGELITVQSYMLDSNEIG